MSGKTSNARHARDLGRSLIGSSMRVEGTIDFVGALQVKGEVLGNVSCPLDSDGSLLVDASGSVIGKVQAPRIVIKGRVVGPMHSSELMEVHAGGSGVGGVIYRSLEVHPGSIVDGLLERLSVAEATDAQPKDGSSEAGDVVRDDTQHGDRRRSGERGGNRRFFRWGVVVVLIGFLVAFLVERESAAPRSVLTSTPAPAPSTPTAPPAYIAAPPLLPPAPPPLPPPPPRVDPVVSGSLPAPAVSRRDTDPPVAKPLVERPEPDMNKVVSISGVNPGKPAAILFLIAKGSAVLVKKKADDASRGTRIDITQGKNISIRVGRDELLRVAAGSGIDIYYQGVKVSSQVIASGTWLRFLPAEPQQPVEAQQPGDAQPPAGDPQQAGTAGAVGAGSDPSAQPPLR